MTESKFPEFSSEQILAADVIRISAEEGSRKLDAISGWMVAGFGAGLALVLANLDTVTSVFHVQNVSLAANLFVWAALMAFVAKFLSTMVAAATSASTAIGEKSKELAESDPNFGNDFSFKTLGQYVETAYWYPWRWIVRLGFRKVLQGDLLFSARLLMRASQLQSIIVLFQAVLHLLSLVALIKDIA